MSKSYEVSDSKDIDAPTANLTAYDLLEDVCRQPESAEGCQCQTTWHATQRHALLVVEVYNISTNLASILYTYQNGSLEGGRPI